MQWQTFRWIENLAGVNGCLGCHCKWEASYLVNLLVLLVRDAVVLGHGRDVLTHQLSLKVGQNAHQSTTSQRDTFFLGKHRL